MSLKNFTKQDFEKAFENYTQAWREYKKFYGENKEILDKFAELESEWRGREWALKEIVEEVAPKEPHLFAENEEVEIRIKKDGGVQIFNKDFYKQK